jgi:hypothetical protein
MTIMNNAIMICSMHKYIVTGARKYACIYFGIKYFYILPLNILVYNLVKHLKFNNMRFTKFLMNSLFLHVQDT